MKFIKQFDEIGKDEIELVGGKGLSLGRLFQANLPVPNGFVITTDAYISDSSTISKELESAIYEAFDKLGAERVAVRSSAIAEDSSEASWAGQFESYLNIGRNELLSSVMKCWQSASSDMVGAYAEDKGVDNDKLALAVVVQKMVVSEVSGVAFSVNPITKDTDEIMIEAIYGLGELIVQGMITPDNYLINKRSLEILDKQIKEKPNMLIYQGGSNVEVPVPEDQRNKSCLNDEQIVNLAKLIKKIEEYYGKPQDIEWAIENGDFYIVQSRPITTI